MHLFSLNLESFRNYSKKTCKFVEETTLVVGGNASGKTNILEACYLLATGRSFRAQRIEEMIFFDKELARISGSVASNSRDSEGQKTDLEILLTRGELQGKRVAKRRYSVDGVFKRVSDFVGNLVVVLFRPEDLQIILGSPSRRRNFLDSVLAQVDREYRRSLASYEKALYRRNRLLDTIREKKASRTQLAFWDQLLVKHGQILTKKRSEFISFVNNFEVKIDSFGVKYKSSLISGERLNKYADQEVAVGYTLVGPHKDDFQIVASNHSRERTENLQDARDLALYGSRGEQRLAVLWLKLAELSYVSEKIGEKPLLLLDDIFSELDQEHRSMVLRTVMQQQTIVTTTDLSLIESNYRKKFKILRLADGS